MLKIDKRSNLSYPDFVEDYLKPNKPVIITDAITQWKAVEQWSLDFFSTEYGNRMVRCRGQAKDVSLSDYIAGLEESSLEKPSPYLRNINIQNDFPKLERDILPRVKYTTPDWASSYLLPYGFPRKRYINQLFISGRGARIILHYDDWMFHNFVSNIQGIKRFTLFPATDTSFVYPMEKDVLLSQIPDYYNVDLNVYPLIKKASPSEVDLGPGESMFIPCGWWHTTLTIETCISVSSGFVGRENWKAFTEEMSRVARVKKKRPLLAMAIHAYLSLAGKALGLIHSK